MTNIDNITKKVLIQHNMEKTAGGYLLPVLGTTIEAASNAISSSLDAGGKMVGAVGDLAEKATMLAAGGAVMTGIAAAYLVNRFTRPRPLKIGIQRDKLYREALKSKITDMRLSQAIEYKHSKDKKNKDLRF